MLNGMEEQRINYLLKSYVNDTLSAPEKEELSHLLRCSTDDRKLGEDMQKVVDELLEQGKVDEVPTEQLWASILEDSRMDWQASPPESGRRSRLLVYYAAVAAVFIAVIGFYYFSTPRNPQDVGQADAALVSTAEQTEEVIQPGTQQATLTLPDGKVIALDDLKEGRLIDGEDYALRLVDGVLQCTGEEAPAVPLMATLNTPRGGEYQMELPDGTQVWLNASSSIRYPISFTGDQREVYIAGEVYFDVKKDVNRPFVVHAADTKITVLGTAFNVSAYAEAAQTQTTLVEGSVRLEKGSAVRKLRPGQQASTSRGENSQIAVRTVDVEEMVAWKNGYFYFHNEHIKSAMEKIARWYDVDVVYVGAMSKKGLDGTISRMENLNQLLGALALTGAAKFTLKGRQIIVQE